MSVPRQLLAGLALGGAATITGVALAMSRSRALGDVETTRTGGVPLDWTRVNDLTRGVLNTFQPCGRRYGNMVRPNPEYAHGSIDVGGRLIGLHVSPELRMKGRLLVEGAATVDPRGDTRITIFPKEGECAPPDEWRAAIRSTLVHELTHATDPYLMKRRPRPMSKEASQRQFCDYINQPFERTAFLNQVRSEVRAPQARQDARRMCAGNKEFAKVPGFRLFALRTPADLLLVSPTWREIRRCLAERDRRTFYKMAARVSRLRDGCYVPR